MEVLKDKFVEVLNIEHGQKVKEFFEKHGVDIGFYNFSNTKVNNYVARFYGVSKGNKIRCCTEEELNISVYEKVTLEDLEKLVNIDKKFDINNFVIEVKSITQGKEVKKFFEGLSNYTCGGYGFNCTSTVNYYGFYNGDFDNYSQNDVLKNRIRIVTLEEAIKLTTVKKELPRVVVVNNVVVGEIPRVVIFENEKGIFCLNTDKLSDINSATNIALYGKDYREVSDTFKVTKQMIADKFGVDINNLEIL